MGVDKFGNCFYNAEFVQNLCPNDSVEVLYAVLVHEVMHLSLKHPERMGDKRVTLRGGITVWNIACDTIVNNIIVQNNLTLPVDGITPHDNRYDFGNGIVIENISSKTADTIYWELLKQAEEQKQNQPDKGQDNSSEVGMSEGDGTGEETDGEGGVKPSRVKGFDEHIDWDKVAEEMTKQTVNGQPLLTESRDWSAINAEAVTTAKMRGSAPSGLGLEFDFLNKPAQINWKKYLNNYIRAAQKTVQSWNRPNRNYLSKGLYLPAYKREGLEVLFAIDTSGSISEDELQAFFSEIAGVYRQFKNVNCRVLLHTTDVYADIEVRDNFLNFVKTVSIKSGGTSHIPLYAHVAKKKYDRDHAVMISFTDGFSEYPVKPSIQTLFIIKNGSVQNVPYGKAIELR
jgi:predicted metal-dependent peptidase